MVVEWAVASAACTVKDGSNSVIEESVGFDERKGRWSVAAVQKTWPMAQSVALMTQLFLVGVGWDRAISNTSVHEHKLVLAAGELTAIAMDAFGGSAVARESMVACKLRWFCQVADRSQWNWWQGNNCESIEEEVFFATRNFDFPWTDRIDVQYNSTSMPQQQNTSSELKCKTASISKSAKSLLLISSIIYLALQKRERKHKCPESAPLARFHRFYKEWEAIPRGM